jgi:hypothetical protein
MEGHYLKRNVDLSLLSEQLIRYFKNQHFRVYTAKEEKKDLIKIIVRPTFEHEIIGNINVLIQGRPNDFSVKFFAGSRSQAYMKFGILTSIFGGGSIFLRGIKSKEALERLERKFWVHLEEKIDFLVNTAGSCKT